MFVNQVTFEMDLENEPMLKNIMKGKLESLQDAPGNAGAEVWKAETETGIGYTLTTKWQAKEDFKTWMVESHKGMKRPKPAEGEKRPRLVKTGRQFESVSL